MRQTYILQSSAGENRQNPTNRPFNSAFQRLKIRCPYKAEKNRLKIGYQVSVQGGEKLFENWVSGVCTRPRKPFENWVSGFIQDGENCLKIGFQVLYGVKKKTI